MSAPDLTIMRRSTVRADERIRIIIANITRMVYIRQYIATDDVTCEFNIAHQ